MHRTLTDTAPPPDPTIGPTRRLQRNPELVQIEFACVLTPSTQVFQEILLAGLAKGEPVHGEATDQAAELIYLPTIGEQGHAALHASTPLFKDPIWDQVVRVGSPIIPCLLEKYLPPTMGRPQRGKMLKRGRAVDTYTRVGSTGKAPSGFHSRYAIPGTPPAPPLSFPGRDREMADHAGWNPQIVHLNVGHASTPISG